MTVVDQPTTCSHHVRDQAQALRESAQPTAPLRPWGRVACKRVRAVGITMTAAVRRQRYCRLSIRSGSFRFAGTPRQGPGTWHGRRTAVATRVAGGRLILLALCLHACYFWLAPRKFAPASCRSFCHFFLRFAQHWQRLCTTNTTHSRHASMRRRRAGEQRRHGKVAESQATSGRRKGAVTPPPSRVPPNSELGATATAPAAAGSRRTEWRV